jgi:hypothetical protein
MKPVGLEKNPGERRPYAVVQLRRDNAADSLYNVVGFQTHLTWPEQKRILQLIPGLQNAEIVRYGVMHRNTYLKSPKILHPTYQAKSHPNWFFAGQMTGVEGYVESTASGWLAGVNAARLVLEQPLLELPPQTIMGSMAHYITHADPDHFQPMNANFGIVHSDLPERAKDKKRTACKSGVIPYPHVESHGMMQEILDFLTYIDLTNTRSVHTRDAYQRDLIMFQHFLIDQGITSFRDVDKKTVLRFIEVLNRQQPGGLKSSTLSRKISSLRSFYRYLASQEKVNHNPVTGFCCLPRISICRISCFLRKSSDFLNPLIYRIRFSCETVRSLNSCMPAVCGSVKRLI